MRWFVISILSASLALTSGCASSSGFRSGSAAGEAARQFGQVRVPAPDIGAAAMPCPDPGLATDKRVAAIENREYAVCSEAKRARAVAGVKAWEREFGR